MLLVGQCSSTQEGVPLKRTSKIPDRGDLTPAHVKIFRRVWSSQCCGSPSSPGAVSPFKDVRGGNVSPQRNPFWERQDECQPPIAVEYDLGAYHTF
jgi:hypothetical protein